MILIKSPLGIRKSRAGFMSQHWHKANRRSKPRQPYPQGLKAESGSASSLRSTHAPLEKHG
ncbi:hypothetical protein J121_545 [Qipengyuania citrea LAMA 915]|uniref:Uncharacterized protein n=1 Tax=Qipengyuania citrea LAMA 915 TaxID=1306953 RepID=A0A0L1KC01_9SPHN|nr:hypothetical protein J121_545 [Qipengyuania citrea LAMA 915]